MTAGDFEGLVAAVVQASADAVFAATPEGRITLWSPAAERIFGIAAADVIGQPTALVLPDEFSGDEHDLVRRAARGETVTRRSIASRMQRGGVLDLWLSAAPVRAADGSITGVLLIARDLTEARPARSSRRGSPPSSSPRGRDHQQDARRHHPSWNAGAERLFGYSAAEVVGKSIRIIIPPERHGRGARCWAASGAASGSITSRPCACARTAAASPSR